ncbi:iron-containing alcohol dehydrogenase [Brevibacillus fulvus]|uniref:Alcohol dehydrogenase YqhD (Iron-dependent ADH family) n=1 Tax=Brevibacillus fulvus TaxID=1125967 RepID=A0A939BRE2_9BACL|nr:iron-containing alcohol dehydrogenase [Brevibacillus fulvus]MBM7589517.1 alcohol dehydrogenase YqhD (iron-dependent ADH family) [Brevibacillus fulvus]
MYSFEVLFPTRIIFGVGELNRLGQEAKTLGKKALLVTGGTSAKKTGLLHRVEQLLQAAEVPFVLFDRVEPNPRTTTVDAAARLARLADCDFLIAVGGGSVMDAAKAIAAAAYSGKPIYDYMRGNPANVGKELVSIKEALPLLTVPTVAATGSEANGTSVLTHWETHEKSSINGPGLIPKISILDPALTYTVPAHVTAEACADIFSHIFEAYLISKGYTHIQDGLAETLIRELVRFSTVAINDPSNEEARATLLWTSTLAISPFTLGGRGAGFPLHKLEHTLSGYHDIAHGRGLAILAIPYFRQVILQDRPDRLARMGRNCFGITEQDDRTAAEAAIEAVSRWFEQLGITQKLSDFGMSRDELLPMAKDTIRINGQGTDHIVSSRPLRVQDVLAIYEACYE